MRQQQEENERPSSSKRGNIKNDQDEIKFAKKRKVGAAKAAPVGQTRGDTQSEEGLALDVEIMDALGDDTVAHSAIPAKGRLKPGPKKKDKNKKIDLAQMDEARDGEFEGILVETGVSLSAIPEDAHEKKKGTSKRNIVVSLLFGRTTSRILKNEVRRSTPRPQVSPYKATPILP